MVRATLHMKVKRGKEREFERAWQAVSEHARSVPGNLRQTLMRDPEDASTYVITTEWNSREVYERFEASPAQHELTAPLRALRESATQVIYDVVADVETPDAARLATKGAEEGKGRVVFMIRLKPGTQDRFLEAYDSIRYEVALGVKGHIVDQVCQSPEDEDAWLITSEWESLDDFVEWERTEGHRELAKPLRQCFDEARSVKYVVRAETAAAVPVE
jgi:heme oxygenase (mycobilin-producing)